MEAEDLFTKFSIPEEFSIRFQLLKAKIFINENNLNEAESILNKVIVISEKNDQSTLLLNAYTGLIKCLTGKEEYQQAYIVMTKLRRIERKLNDDKKVLSSLLVEAKYRDKSRSEEIQRLKYRLLRISVVGTIGILLILFVVLFWRRKRIRDRSRQEQELKQVLTRIHREHEMVDSIQSQLERLMKKEGGKLKDKLKIISVKLDELKIVDSERDQFLATFDSFFESSYRKLSSLNEDLTRTDCRYALLFALGLSSHAIAKIGGIKTESVRKIRQRLKVKLKLDVSDDLKIYLDDLIVTSNLPRLKEFERKINTFY